MDVDVAEELLDMDVPKLFLQPFVENAIIHGFAEMDGGGVIRIRGRREGEAAVFTVEDNGRGFTPERLARMASGEGQSTGMANVGKRIRLLYGPPYGSPSKAMKGAARGLWSGWRQPRAAGEAVVRKRRLRRRGRKRWKRRANGGDSFYEKPNSTRAVLLLLTVMLAASGCGRPVPDRPDGAGKERVTITYATWGSPNERAAHERIVRKF